MKIDLLVDFEDDIIVSNITDGSIKLYKDKQNLKSMLHSHIDSLMISKTIRHNVSINGRRYDDIVRYDTTNASISFADNAIKKNSDIIRSLNSKRLSDMFIYARNMILSGDINNVYLTILPYNENNSMSRLVKEDATLSYEVHQDISGNLNLGDLDNMKSLIDMFIKTYGLTGINVKSSIYGKNGLTLVGVGEPIESIIDRKVENYEKRI
ncbi:MAG: hypothetical protein IJ565_05380 [Bacilli bacterium]|nr:hypothetical protein [Bacilli bacterium]